MPSGGTFTTLYYIRVATAVASGIFFLAYNMDALQSRNMLQLEFNYLTLYLNLFFSLLSVAFVMLLNSHPLKIIIPQVIFLGESVVSLIVTFVFFRIIRPQIGWDTYKIVGASTDALQMWKTWQKYLVYLKWFCMTLPFNYLDITIMATALNAKGNYLWLIVSLFYGVGIIICAGFFACIWISHYACRVESKALMNAVICFYLLAAAIMITQVIYLRMDWAVLMGWGMLVSWILLLIYQGLEVKSNFGKGMKVHFQNEVQALKKTKGTIRIRNQQLDDDDDVV